MRLEDFKESLYKAGWRDISDAQHKGIEKLWRELFPHSASLEDELEILHKDYDNLLEDYLEDGGNNGT